MEYYVGLDVSLKQTSICVVDQSGSVVREGVVDSDPEAISVYLRSKAPDAVRIGLETGPTSTWLWTELKRPGLPVICIDARHAKAVLKMQINRGQHLLHPLGSNILSWQPHLNTSRRSAKMSA
jgi:transposase